ncbi:MAG: hypothetical protein LBG24_11485 [Treponema sp.]|jgi:hypothetical protein|nr:hypothetical protein [Treponema sp.]
MYRKTIYRILPALSLALGIFLEGCSSHLQAPDIPEGLGLLQIHLTPGEGRTLIPDITFARYDLTLSTEGEESITRSITAGESLTVELIPVIWTITAQGFAQAGDETPIAQGSLSVKIKSGSTETITLPLGPLEDVGVGTFRYTISLPEGLSSATLTLSSLANSENPVIRNLGTEGSNGTISGRAAGYYRLNLTMDREVSLIAGQRTSLSEVVHIYDGAETGFILSAEAAAALAWAYLPKAWLSFDHGRRITDADVPATQNAWELQNTYYVPSGQSVVLVPLTGNIPQGAVYEWTIDNTPVHTGEILTRAFTAPSSLVKVTAKVDAVTHATASTLVKTASAGPRSGGTKAQAATCIEFSPAPGQFVGRGNGYSNPAITDLSSLTEEDVRDIVQQYLDGHRTFNNIDYDGKVFSLGGWGGYYILGFDHSVPNGSGADLRIASNYHVAHMGEAGVVWVSQDLNGDGKPNELWYPLKGSQASSIKGYAMVYFKPRDASSAFWIDTQGGTGTFSYYPNGNDGYPYHITGKTGTYVMFTGTLLQDSNLNGYVDAGSVTFDLSDAVDAAGNGLSLEYIDFVKVQTGLNKDGAGVGEYSTEAGIPEDLHFGG